MVLTITTLMLAVKAMQRDIARNEALASDATLDDNDLEYYGQMVMDQLPAFAELRQAYEEEQANNPEFPPLDELLFPEKYQI
ncbi:hypothetical protein V8J88_23185 [Massilia sp. W12]|uniref:hypothetical protein n=1 Tax=Massilia sp. W12 TaxID=3126507 RepID=UPI0030CF0B2D